MTSSAVVLPRKGKRLNPYAGLSYPNEGKPAKPPNGRNKHHFDIFVFSGIRILAWIRRLRVLAPIYSQIGFQR